MQCISARDVASFKSTAKKQGNDWILNGEKTYISSTEEAKRLGGGYFVARMLGSKFFFVRYVVVLFSGVCGFRVFGSFVSELEP